MMYLIIFFHFRPGVMWSITNNYDIHAMLGQAPLPNDTNRIPLPPVYSLNNTTEYWQASLHTTPNSSSQDTDLDDIEIIPVTALVRNCAYPMPCLMSVGA